MSGSGAYVSTPSGVVSSQSRSSGELMLTSSWKSSQTSATSGSTYAIVTTSVVLARNCLRSGKPLHSAGSRTVDSETGADPARVDRRLTFDGGEAVIDHPPPGKPPGERFRRPAGLPPAMPRPSPPFQRQQHLRVSRRTKRHAGQQDPPRGAGWCSCGTAVAVGLPAEGGQHATERVSGPCWDNRLLTPDLHGHLARDG